MATSSRPFQSQTVARLVAGWRAMAHGSGRWLRQGRTAAVWALQVVVYPLYAAAQAVRLAQRQLRATQPWQPLWARLTGTRPPALASIPADTPIRALLSVVQPPAIGGPLTRAPKGRLVHHYGQWLRQSQAGAVLTPGQWHLVPLAAPLGGVASDLASRQLVLVTVGNDIFADLTPDQQRRLHWAIALMLAEQGRLAQQQAIAQRLQQPGLPLPGSNSALLPPLRWIPSLVRWMQTSPLAAATNLFGEADQQWALGAAGDRRGAPPPRRSLPPGGRRPAIAWPWGVFALGPIPTTAGDRGGNLVVASPQAVVATTPPGPAPIALEESRPRGQSAVVPAWVSPSPGLVSLEPFPRPTPALPLATHTLEAQVVQVSYVDAPLVVVLRGIDWVLCGLETRLRALWAWLQRHW